MKIYLDIYGVLLTQDESPAPHVGEFLRFVTDNFDCYWLSTHNHGGSAGSAEYLLRFLPKDLERAVKKIKPTVWWAAKTEGIDWDSDFLWLDDNLSEETELELLAHDRKESFVLINLTRNPNQLEDVRQRLATRLEADKAKSRTE